MNYTLFYKTLSKFWIFSISDIDIYFPNFDKRRLSERKKKWYIANIIKWRYFFVDKKSEIVAFLIANKINNPSYISCESAMKYHNLIPEWIYTNTSITTNKTTNYQTPIWNFKYYKIKSMLFFGYDLIKIWNTICKIANKEKAVLDFLYLKPWYNTKSKIAELRIDSFEFLDGFDENRRNQYLQQFNQKQLTKRANILLNYLKEND